MDERFIMHRYKSTSHAGVVGAVLMGAWFMYERLAQHQNRWDLLIILGAMAVTKQSLLLWYRHKD